MDYNKKKITFISSESIIRTVSGEARPTYPTDFTIRQDVVDKLRSMPLLGRVSILANKPTLGFADFTPMGKAVEFFVFLYCNVAADMHVCYDEGNRMMPDAGMIDEVLDVLPKGLKSIGGILFVGCSDIDKETASRYCIDYIDVEDFVCGN